MNLVELLFFRTRASGEITVASENSVEKRGIPVPRGSLSCATFDAPAATRSHRFHGERFMTNVAAFHVKPI